MTEFSSQTFQGETLDTDGNRYIDCAFRETTFVYRGGEHPRFDRCSFQSCGWHFAGPAVKTIQFLQQIRGAPGGEGLFAQIFAPGAFMEG